MRKQWLIITLAIITTAHAGVYRHDVSPEKYKKLARERQFDCVGMVLDKNGQELRGSCVLIGNKYVLSAAHCFIKMEMRVDTFYLDQNGKVSSKPVKGGAKLYVNQPVKERPDSITNYSFRFGNRRYYPRQCKIYPTYLDSLGHTFGGCADIVLIELEDTVEGTAPAVLNRFFDEKGAVITGVGYGASGPADKPADIGPYHEKIAGQNMVDEVVGYEINGKPTLLAFDLDHPTRKDCNQMGSAKPLPMEWAPGGGDSGGGLFRQVKGQWQLVGIITGGPRSGVDTERLMKTGYYGGISENTRISAFYEWIQTTMHDFEMAGMKVNMDINLKK